MKTDKRHAPDTCHSERSEESSVIRACASAAGSFARLRMTSHGYLSVLICEIRGEPDSFNAS
jgi:hypothetical protein